MRGWKLRVAALGLAALLVVTAGCSTGGVKATTGNDGPNDEPIKIGLNTDINVGGAIEQGVANMQGFELAIKEYNDKGGYHGRPVKLVIYDDEAKPEKAVANVTRLINDDKVIAIAGFVNSGNALASEHLAQQAQIPMLVTMGTATAITAKFENEPKNYIFRYSILDADQVTVMLNWAQKRGFKKIGLMHDTSGYGVAGKTDALKKMEALGIKPVATESFNSGDTDMTTQLLHMKSAGADAILMYTLSAEDAHVVLSAQKINYAPVFFGAWSISYGTFLKTAGSAAEGVYMTTSYVVGKNPGSAELSEKLKQTYGADTLPVASSLGYDSAKLLLQALDAAGPDPVKLRDALENTSEFQGVVGKLVKPFGPKDHEALGVDQIFMGVWHDNKIVEAN